MAKRSQVCEEVRKWRGTPFLHQQRVRGLGVDCVGLVLSVTQDLGLSDRNGVPFDRNDHAGYGPQPVATYVLDTCKRRLLQKPIEQMKPGDVFCMKVPIDPTHTGFIVDGERGEFHVVHAYDGGMKRCIEHVLDTQWRRRIAAVFQIPGVEDD